MTRIKISNEIELVYFNKAWIIKDINTKVLIGLTLAEMDKIVEEVNKMNKESEDR